MSRKTKGVPGGNRHASEVIHSRRGNSTRRHIESARTQRERLLAFLIRRGSVSTREARGRELRIMSPAARVFELKERGVDIFTLFDEQQGCGRYYLRGGHDAIDG